MEKEIKIFPPLIKEVADCLHEIFNEKGHAERVIHVRLKSNRKLGSRDRSFIAENVYDIIRWWRLLRKLDAKRWGNDGAGTYEDFGRILGISLILKGYILPKLDEFVGLVPKKILSEKAKLESDRVIIQSIPNWLDELGVEELGEEQWAQEIAALNAPAPVTLRINTLKTTKFLMRKALNSAGFPVAASPIAPEALIMEKRSNITGHSFFERGLFEIQDAGSQRIAPFLQVEKGMQVIDACAGAGGKTLHLATLMENDGYIMATDIDGYKLKELMKRAERNGISIIQTEKITSKFVKEFQGSADRLLLDVPCSGLGVLRRNPDAKWKLSPEQIEEVKKTQAGILQSYSRMLKPGGLMVYATCSILPSENEQQVQQFLENNPDFELEEERTISPAKYDCDGFYMARMKLRG